MRHSYFINGESVPYDTYVEKGLELSRKRISHSYEKRKCYEENLIIHDIVYGDWKLQPVKVVE